MTNTGSCAFTYSFCRCLLCNYYGPCTQIGVVNVGSITAFARGRKSLSDGIMGDFSSLLVCFFFFLHISISSFTISMTGIIIICLRGLSYHIATKCRMTSWCWFAQDLCPDLYRKAHVSGTAPSPGQTKTVGQPANGMQKQCGR